MATLYDQPTAPRDPMFDQFLMGAPAAPPTDPAASKRAQGGQDLFAWLNSMLTPTPMTRSPMEASLANFFNAQAGSAPSGTAQPASVTPVNGKPMGFTPAAEWGAMTAPTSVTSRIQAERGVMPHFDAGGVVPPDVAAFLMGGSSTATPQAPRPIKPQPVGFSLAGGRYPV